MKNGAKDVVDPRALAIVRLIGESRALFHRARAAAEELHADLGLSAGMRGVLREVAVGGPKTVPAMARRRPASRQHVQALVNRLLERGLVEYRENPAHRRSSLVAATPAGEATSAEIARREARILDEIELPQSDAELRGAAEALRALREAVDERGSADAASPHALR